MSRSKRTTMRDGKEGDPLEDLCLRFSSVKSRDNLGVWRLHKLLRMDYEISVIWKNIAKKKNKNLPNTKFFSCLIREN